MNKKIYADKKRIRTDGGLSLGGFSVHAENNKSQSKSNNDQSIGNSRQQINFYKAHVDLLTLGTSGLPLPQTHNQNQSNNKKNVEYSVNSNSLFSRVQNHDNFPFFANITAKTSPIMAGGKLIVNNNNNLPSVKSGAKNTDPNHPAERFANQPDSTSNRSLSNNQDFIEQINRSISMTDFQQI